MIIKLEPDLTGMARQVELTFSTASHVPFRLTLTASHLCVAEDLYRLAVEIDKALTLIDLPVLPRPA